MTDAQIVFAINIGIGILSALLCYLMYHLLTKRSVDEFYSDSYKAALAIETDVKIFKTARPATLQMAIDAVNKSRDVIEKKGVAV